MWSQFVHCQVVIGGRVGKTRSGRPSENHDWQTVQSFPSFVILTPVSSEIPQKSHSGCLVKWVILGSLIIYLQLVKCMKTSKTSAVHTMPAVGFLFEMFENNK